MAVNKIFEKVYLQIVKDSVYWLKRNGVRRPSILDVGCGYGVMYNYFKRFWNGVCDYVGVEKDEIACCRSAEKGMFVIMDDAYEFVKTAEITMRFDVIIIANFFESTNWSIERIKEFLENVIRLLKPNGLLIFTMINADHYYNLGLRMKGYKVRAWTLFDVIKLLSSVSEKVNWKMSAVMTLCTFVFSWLPSWITRFLNYVFDRRKLADGYYILVEIVK